MVRQYQRVLKLSKNNMARKIFVWDKKLNNNNQIQSWFYEVETIFIENEIQDLFYSGNIFTLKQVIEKISKNMLTRQQTLLQNQCIVSPKL